MRGSSLAMAADGFHVPPPPPGWLTPILTFLGATLTAVLVFLGQRALARPAVQAALNDTFTKLLAAEEKRGQRLEDELTASRNERFELRTTLERERVETAAERAALRGEIRNLTQTVESLQAQLDRHGIPTGPRAVRPTPEHPAPGMIILSSSDPFALPEE